MQKPSLKRMPKPRIVGLVFLFVLWIMFAAWQRTEHVHQCELIHDSLSSQAECVVERRDQRRPVTSMVRSIRSATIAINTGCSCQV